MSKLVTQLFTSNGSWLAPARITQVRLLGIGAGGGGGGGGGGFINTPGAGGAGGGGAQQAFLIVTVVPGSSYTVTIGLGGTAGTLGVGITPGSPGGDGGDTTFDALATFRGAGGGQGGIANQFTTGFVVSGQPSRLIFPGTGDGAPQNPGEGGLGVTRSWTAGQFGNLHVQGAGTSAAAGGLVGPPGVDISHPGASGGGGGGASTWQGNVPGNGGQGGFGYPSFVPGFNGGNGTLGAGGGGGGGGGSSDVSIPIPTVGGEGGVGGNGALIVAWIE